MLFLFLFMLLTLNSPAFGVQAPVQKPEGPFVIHQMIGHPTHTTKFFAITSNYGVLRSEDSGLTWQTANQGLKSFTHHAIAITPTNPPRLYVGAWGGGVSISLDGGESWTEFNDQLGNTAIDALVVDPGESGQSDRLYAATSTQFYRTAPDGSRWLPFEEGLPPFPEEIKFKSLLLLPGPPKTLWYGNSQGLFHRNLDAPSWSEEPQFRQIRVSALAHDNRSGQLWVGTLGKGLFVRNDQAAAWRSLSTPPGLWINTIAIHPTRPATIDLATRGRGLYKSTDGGAQWAPANRGLEETDIRSLAVHPSNPDVLLAGTTSKGFFRSTNGGDEWAQVPLLPALNMDGIIAMMTIDSATQAGAAAPTSPAVPAAFAKCNRCHGWTDPALNQKHTYWRVPPNRRDWKPTVDRMAQRTGLTPKEQSAITEFLTVYSQQMAPDQKIIGKNTPQPAQEEGYRLMVDRCGACHGMSLDGRCLAGACETGRVHAVTPRPWDMVIPWMRAMGCAMTDAEQATLTGYLMRHYGKRYSVEWAPAGAVPGGWNVVALAPFQGRLFAGIEGNGSIVQLADDLTWTPVLTTPNYTIYGLVPFRGQLYAATNDPAAEIWSSPDGEHWRLQHRLAGEKGIISLGVFNDKLYAGTARAAIYQSTDGISWSPASRLLPDARPSFSHWVRFLLPFDGALYAGIESGGIYRSDDGTAWRPDWPADAPVGVRGAAIFQGTFYVGTTSSGEIWKRQPGMERRWVRVFSADTKTRGYVASLAVLGDFLYAGVNGLVFRTNDGLRWEEIGHLGPYTIEALAPIGDHLYAGTALPPNAWIYRTNGKVKPEGDHDE